MALYPRRARNRDMAHMSLTAMIHRSLRQMAVYSLYTLLVSTYQRSDITSRSTLEGCAGCAALPSLGHITTDKLTMLTYLLIQSDSCTYRVLRH